RIFVLPLHRNGFEAAEQREECASRIAFRVSLSPLPSLFLPIAPPQRNRASIEVPVLHVAIAIVRSPGCAFATNKMSESVVSPGVGKSFTRLDDGNAVRRNREIGFAGFEGKAVDTEDRDLVLVESDLIDGASKRAVAESQCGRGLGAVAEVGRDLNASFALELLRFVADEWMCGTDGRLSLRIEGVFQGLSAWREVVRLPHGRVSLPWRNRREGRLPAARKGYFGFGRSGGASFLKLWVPILVECRNEAEIRA